MSVIVPYNDSPSNSRYGVISDADCEVYKSPYIRADPLDPNSLAIANWARNVTNDVRALKARVSQNEETTQILVEQVRSNSHKIDLIHGNVVVLSQLTEDISYALSTSQQVNSICDTVDGFTETLSAIPVVGQVFSLGLNAAMFGVKMYADSLPRAAARELSSFRANVLSSTFNDMIHQREHTLFVWQDDQDEKVSHLEKWLSRRAQDVANVEAKTRNPQFRDAVEYYKVDNNPHKLGIVMPVISPDTESSSVETITCDTTSAKPIIQTSSTSLQGASMKNVLMNMFYRLIGNNREGNSITKVGSEPLATTGDVYASRLQNFSSKILSLLPKEMDDVSSIVRSFLHNGSSR